MRPSEWVLIQYGRCPYKKRKFGDSERHHWGTHTKERLHENRHSQKAAISKTRKKSSEETNPDSNLILDFWPTDCEKINLCGCSCPVYGILRWWPEQTNLLTTCLLETTTYIDVYEMSYNKDDCLPTNCTCQTSIFIPCTELALSRLMAEKRPSGYWQKLCSCSSEIKRQGENCQNHPQMIKKGGTSQKGQSLLGAMIKAPKWKSKFRSHLSS